MTIPLKNEIIYGPVNSRRLGKSLGINLLPKDFKHCTFNCVYCQYGWTESHKNILQQPELWRSLAEISDAIKDALQFLNPKPDYLTFSGNGEPTLHPHFPEIVNELIKIRNLFSSGSKTAILTNSSTVNHADIKKAIDRLDVKIMKLDCGNEAYFKKFNIPVPGLTLNNIVDGLTSMENITIQSLFAGGTGGNYNPQNIDDWIKLLQIIAPDFVQIYTLDRSYPSAKIIPLEKNELQQIKSKVSAVNINCEIY